ncbi:hypothetical protein ACLQ24_02770 [Micromonospora sp. DT4]|uniref:hypothetical protein n=1 Tax=Micromonospora sp. DT4 TaxID=3393438 RepID=UPI003CF7F730
MALLAAMLLSLGAVLGPVSTRPGVQFLFENARTVGTCLLCLAGFGGATVAVARGGRRPSARRAWLRVGITSAVTLAFFAVQPLPAGADPTFKAYTLDDVVDPRYFFVCRGPVECAAYNTAAPVTFGTRAEKTKVRVNGVVSARVARLDYRPDHRQLRRRTGGRSPEGHPVGGPPEGGGVQRVAATRAARSFSASPGAGCSQSVGVAE